MTTPELKPCPNPWCQATDVVCTTVRMTNYKTKEVQERKRVECTEGCGLCGPQADTLEEAARQWNDRPGETVLWEYDITLPPHGIGVMMTFGPYAVGYEGKPVRVKIVEA